MMLGLRFGTIRLVVLLLSVSAQLYLFLCIRKAILSSGISDRTKARAVHLAGALIILLFTMNGYILARNIVWVDPPLVAQILLFYLPAVWGFGSILSALLLCVAHLAGGLVRLVVRHSRHHVDPDASFPADPDRRRFLQTGIAGLAAAPFLLSGYGAAYSSKACVVRELTLPFGRTLRVVQLSDIHAGVYMTREEIRRYAEQVSALAPDLFVITGDFISNSLEFLPGCVEELTRVRTRYGTFATLGNHENWYGRPSGLRTVFRKYGIPLLVNAHQIIETKQGSFAIAGIDDLRTGYPNLEAALHGLNAAMPTLLLSHRPEIFPRAAAHGILVTLAGHWHGGQIKVSLPGLTLSPAHLMTSYPEGLYQINGSHLYVSRGIGTTFTPVRLNVPPEISVINLA